MAKQPLGQLEKVDLRTIWESEGSDFTPWLATLENLEILGDTIDLELELEAQEQKVGPFRADILCKETGTGHWVLIENQLERTDHTHLGQLMTYAAGLQAVTIVWIAARFTEEHRAALDWLNEITDDSFRFFGLEIELWRIGASPAAPRFNIISKPNDWTKAVGTATRQIESQALTETKQKQLSYWLAFREYLIEQRSPIKPTKPYPQHWMSFSIGRANFNLTSTLHSGENRLGVELYIGDENAKSYFHQLKAHQQEIEAELGFALAWLELPQRKACRIIHYKQGVDPLDEAQWPAHRQWMKDCLEKFWAVFRQRVRSLEVDDEGETGGDA